MPAGNGTNAATGQANAFVGEPNLDGTARADFVTSNVDASDLSDDATFVGERVAVDDRGLVDPGETAYLPTNDVLKGLRVYDDLNDNGPRDAGEPFTDGDVRPEGPFELTDAVGTAGRIRVVVPTGYRMNPAAGRPVALDPDVIAAGVDLGIIRLGTVAVALYTPPAATAALSGFTFDDADQNGAYAADESRPAARRYSSTSTTTACWTRTGKP